MIARGRDILSHLLEGLAVIPITGTSNLARQNLHQLSVPAQANIVCNVVFLIVFVGLFCDALEKGRQAQFTDFCRQNLKKGSNIESRTDIVRCATFCSINERIKSAKSVASQNVTRQKM
jgi:hypothetical protein